MAVIVTFWVVLVTVSTESGGLLIEVMGGGKPLLSGRGGRNFIGGLGHADGSGGLLGGVGFAVLSDGLVIEVMSGVKLFLFERGAGNCI